MACLLGILASGRRNGYTSSLLREALKGAKNVEGVEIEFLHLRDYKFGPCISCFKCIRDPEHFCTLDDDFGRRGKGELFRKIERANGIFLADAVHIWGPTACAHLFIERCYPFLWSGILEGMPFASLSCATNQGMQILANREICKWAFSFGLRYIGGLPVHTSYLDRALIEANHLGEKLAEAAKVDAQGREKFADDKERWFYYMDKPWNAFIPYLENLTAGTFKSDSSLIETALRHNTFKRKEAIELLKRAQVEFEVAMRYYNLNDYKLASEHLVKASALWTHSTWKEFLELEVVKTEPPEAYRPLPQDEDN